MQSRNKKILLNQLWQAWKSAMAEKVTKATLCAQKALHKQCYLTKHSTRQAFETQNVLAKFLVSRCN